MLKTILISLVLCLVAISSTNAAIVTADHNAVDQYEDIPAAWRDSIATKYIWQLHQSHGCRNICGMEYLYADNSTLHHVPFVGSEWWTSNCGASDLGQGGDTCYINILRDTLTNNSDIDAITWSFSHNTTTNDSLDVIAHITAMHNLASDFPNVAVIMQTAQLGYSTFTQGHRDSITQLNHWVRGLADTITLDNFFIFDVADILGFNRNTQQYDSTAHCSTDAWIETYISDSSITPVECEYITNTDLTWTTAANIGDWNCHHAGNVTSYVPYNCPDAANYICESHGKAMLWLLARSAGWEGVDVNENIWYVSKANGDDANGGHSWDDAFRTIDAVNNNLIAGDTVVFGAGVYDSLQIIPPLNGADSGWTLYIDSSKYYGGPGFTATLSGGENITGWVIYSNTDSVDVWVAVGHAFRDTWTGSAGDEGGDLARCWTLRYGDSLFKPYNSIDSLLKYGNYTMCHRENAGGTANDTIYIGLPNGITPSNLGTIRGSARPVFRFAEDAQQKIRIEGFKIYDGKQGCVLFTNGAVDSIQIVSCSLKFVGHGYGENPALIMSRTKAFGPPVYFKVATHVEIYNCDFTKAIGTNDSYYEHSGSGIEGYCAEYWRVKGCSFRNLPGTGLYWKNEIDIHDTMMSNNVVDSCYFNNLGGYGVCAGETGIHDTVINCIFDSIGEAAISLNHQVTNLHGGHAILNNTIRRCNNAIWDWHAEDSTLTTTAKYNIVSRTYVTIWDGWRYRTGDYYRHYAFRSDANYDQWDIDSNWYDANVTDSTATPFRSAGDRNFAGWQSQGHDSTAGAVTELFMDWDSYMFYDTTSFTIDVTHSGRTWTHPGANWGVLSTTRFHKIEGTAIVGGKVRIP